MAAFPITHVLVEKGALERYAEIHDAHVAAEARAVAAEARVRRLEADLADLRASGKGGDRHALHRALELMATACEACASATRALVVDRDHGADGTALVPGDRDGAA